MNEYIELKVGQVWYVDVFNDFIIITHVTETNDKFVYDVVWGTGETSPKCEIHPVDKRCILASSHNKLSDAFSFIETVMENVIKEHKFN